ncbi:MAG: iron-sulfur cluster assembly protein [Bacteroidales bacterium]|jgi:FeS assembly SUF system protein|nr:iron-sulfur cluster assembly protein [Bacteroidales bacterium]
MDKTAIHDQIVETLKDIYDPEIPANIYDLGLIYKIDLEKLPEVTIEMTFTSPTCPMAEIIVYQIESRLKLIEGIEQVQVNVVFEPEWNQDCMSDEAKLKLGFL